MIPEPKKGLSDSFDKANKKMDKIYANLDELLEKTKKQLKIEEITYHTESKIHKFQFEIPKSAAKKIPKGFSISSK